MVTYSTQYNCIISFQNKFMTFKIHTLNMCSYPTLWLDLKRSPKIATGYFSAKPVNRDRDRVITVNRKKKKKKKKKKKIFFFFFFLEKQVIHNQGTISYPSPDRVCPLPTLTPPQKKILKKINILPQRAYLQTFKIALQVTAQFT